MPIEIKELHIRVSINAPQSGTPAGTAITAGAGGNMGEELKDAIVAECVEQVLQILQGKAER